MHPTDFKLIKVGQVGKSYCAGGNVAWASPFWAPCSVPVINAATNTLMNGKWREPRGIDLTIAVCSHSDPTKEQQRFKSQLKRISPEEEHAAFILATWRDVSAGQTVEDACSLFVLKCCDWESDVSVGPNCFLEQTSL